ncbi:MAG: NADH-quinone oxidoreductase subunit L [Gemmatales bacterium]|nr:NADH-quinone oxidoreductase subunit L [Gemmatales bacterium]MDW8387922.1 NADH-quinone oxidoreductase subunit L [Gemmatales bacterium]
MSDLDVALRIVPALPLVGSILTAFLGNRLLGSKSHLPVVVGLAGAVLFSFMVLVEAPGSGRISTSYDFVDLGNLHINVVLRADALTAMMLVTVNLVGFLVAVYSRGYMAGDPGYARYFAELGLFVFSMSMLVLSSNFLLLYVFWEAVGLCSYLLIGFWYERPSAAAAARKAFLVNRIGDAGFLLGLMLMWTTFGTLDYDGVFRQVEQADPATLTAICLLLFTGAIGKSAQFPLHVWLPDAMEGPSPVSALIHAATMVTAGVYLVARSTPLFVASPTAQLIVAGIGGFTALLAALMALTQFDLKRVLAYSTVSQLGLMFLALGAAAGQPKLAEFAVVAAVFHLFTHAFFKALLFLAAGSVMHAMGDVIDMRRFGGLRRLLPWTHALFLVGALALAGVVPLAGFWSKDEILAAVHEASHGPYPGFFTVCYYTAVLTTFLTAFYTFRAYFLTFWGEERVPEEAHGHAHESGWVMLVPMALLAVGAALAGILFGPTHLFAEYLGKTPIFATHGEEHGLNWTVMMTSTLAAGVGIGLAAWLYVLSPSLPERLRRSLPGLYELSSNRFYLDELYGVLFVGPATMLSNFCRLFDQYIVDGVVDLVGWVPGAVGRVFQTPQNGLVQYYALATTIGLAIFLVFVVLTLRG